MAISDTITSIENHLTADYEGLENIGADLTGINKNILNIRTILDTIYNDMPKVTGEGTEVTLSPTRKGRLALIPKGNSTQESTTGKNMLSAPSNFNEEHYGINFKNENGVYTLSATTITANYLLEKEIAVQHTIAEGEYVHILNDSTSSSITFGFGFSDNTNASFYVSTLNNIASLSSYVGKTITKIRLYANTNYNGNVMHLSPMICSSSTSTSWEKYTGGIPAPNPSFPFPIKSVTGNNNVVVNSRNLFNISDIASNTAIISNKTENSFVITKDGTGRFTNTISLPYTIPSGTTLQCTATLSDSTLTKNLIIQFGYDSTMSNDTCNFNGSKTLTADSNCIRIGMNSSEESGATAKVTNLQLEIGLSATSYQPYSNQTLPLNLGNIELNEIDTYKDLIFKAENGNAYYDSLTSEQKALLTYGKWYKHNAIRKVEANISDMNNASESYPGWKNTTLTTQMFSDLEELRQNTHLDDVTNYLCNVGIEGSENFIIMSNRTNNVIFIYGSGLTQTQWKTNYSSLVFKLYYGLPSAKQEDIEITDTTLISQLEEIDKMKSYSGTTIITSTYDSNNAQMILSASALKGE